MFDWNDLKYLLAVANHGSTVAAAKALGVNQSTVQRRMAELERQLGRPLLVREPSGYQLTPLGRELLPLAEKVAAAIDAFELRVKSTAPDGRDVIRLTCPEPVVGRLRPLIEKFHRQHPGYKVEFVTSDRYLDLLKGRRTLHFALAIRRRRWSASKWRIRSGGSMPARRISNSMANRRQRRI